MWAFVSSQHHINARLVIWFSLWYIIQSLLTPPKPLTTLPNTLMSTKTNKPYTSSDRLTFTEIEEYASYFNLTLRNEIKGPYLKLEAITNDEKAIVVGYLTAFIRPLPFKLFQLDTIQVKNRRQNIGFKRKGWKIDGSGISFIMGTWALIFAKNQGCSNTELLAVKDSDAMNDILVRLYQSFGFVIKKQVGEDDVMDRLTWGAVGTLMAMNIDAFFTEWTPKTRILLEGLRLRKKQQQEQVDLQ